jgi:hypothetical protein
MLLRHTHQSSDNPETRYYACGDQTLNTHDGQMKLLLADEMSIMEGLRHIITKHNIGLQDLKDKKMVAVVVAGASPGQHFVNLISTFAFIDFHLYDPCEQSPWDKVLVAHATTSSSRNIFLFKAKFTNEKALEWRKTNTKYEYVIFLSDIPYRFLCQIQVLYILKVGCDVVPDSLEAFLA